LWLPRSVLPSRPRPSPTPGAGRGQGCLSPLSERGFQALTVQATQDQVERRGTGRACPREAQGLQQGGPIVAPPLPDRAVTAVAAQHRRAGQGQHGPQGIALAPCLPQVGNLC
jgi:hypothetical protein